MSKFHIRDTITTPYGSDAAFIADAFDSATAFLATIGSAKQWGVEPVAAQPRFMEETVDMTKGSHRGQPVRMFIAEVALRPDEQVDPGLRVREDAGGQRWLLVAGATVHTGAYFPAYITRWLPEGADFRTRLEDVGRSEKDWFLEHVVADFRTGEMRKGAGSALLERVHEFAKANGVENLWLDCWSGNGGRLSR
jgi:hypothetical protein